MQPAEVVAAEPLPRPRKRHTGLTVAVAVVLALAGAATVGYLLLRPEQSAANKARDNCHAAVLDKLRAPGTAKFVGEPTVTDNGIRYFIDGEVDSQNGFGALVRSTYSCITGKNTTVIDEANLDSR